VDQVAQRNDALESLVREMFEKVNNRLDKWSSRVEKDNNNNSEDSSIKVSEFRLTLSQLEKKCHKKFDQIKKYMAETNQILNVHSLKLDNKTNDKNNDKSNQDATKSELTVKYDNLIKSRLDDSLLKVQEFVDKHSTSTTNVLQQMKLFQSKIDKIENKLLNLSFEPVHKQDNLTKEEQI